MTIVYALLHSWDEGGSEIRGLYYSEEEALKDLPVEIVEDEKRCWTLEHDQFCCYVQSYPVRTRAIGASALPKLPPQGFPLIPEAAFRAIFETMTRRFPDNLKRSADATETKAR